MGANPDVDLARTAGRDLWPIGLPGFVDVAKFAALHRTYPPHWGNLAFGNAKPVRPAQYIANLANFGGSRFVFLAS